MRTASNRTTSWSVGGVDVTVRADLRAPMRDGVELAVDVYQGLEDKPRPALLAYSPYGKELQAQALTLPPQVRPSPLWDGCIEAGDIATVVGADYAHVIADARGSGSSGGVMRGNYCTGAGGAGKDVYDLVEWIAEQPWCDGNVGMIGVSYFSSMMILGAAERPPHLKAIFTNGGHYDNYETAYHGGILWFMPRAAREGRGGDSGIAVGAITSRLLDELEPDELEKRVQDRLSDPDVRLWPNLVHVLDYPETRELWFDVVMNPLDGPFYKEFDPIAKADRIDIPTYMQVKWGRGWTVDGTINTYEKLRGPKRLELQGLPPMQERPYHENHDVMLRWYDYWLKGIDNGIMDEPEVNVFVEGAQTWRRSDRWPLPGVEYQDHYLRTLGRLSPVPERFPVEDVPPDGFYQAPLTVSKQISKLLWRSDALLEPVEMAGTGAAHIFAEIDTDDTNFIVKIYDIAPDGRRKQVTTGYLKASHRELDEEKTSEGDPHHPHTRAVPVEPGRVEEYVIRIYPFANMFKAGHRIEVELACNEPMEDEHSVLLPPESYHLPIGRPTMVKVYRDFNHPSRLVLPVIRDEAAR